MMMTRRGFLGFLATGTVSACVLAKIPTAWVPEPVRRYAAIEFMRAEFNRFGALPDRLFAGRALYEAYQSELVANVRFMSGDRTAPATRPHLLFKGVPLFEDAAQLAPWEFQLEAGRLAQRATMRPTLRRAA